MNVLVVIGFVAIVGLSVTVIFSSIQDNQDLTEINNEISQKQYNAISVSSGISGAVDDGDIVFENSLNDRVEIIQIRVYDDAGIFVKSFPINQTIPGNISLYLDDLDSELQVMLGDESP